MWWSRKERKNILVSGGVDIKNQMPASKKGMYFTGNEQDFRTYSVGSGVVTGWELNLLDLDTGIRYSRQFLDQMWIGRQSGEVNDYFLALPHDKQISKVHCRIYEVDGKLCIHDQGSKNHTYVNGNRIDGPVWLEQGYTIKIGLTNIKVERVGRLGKK